MFTGIVESLAKVVSIDAQGTNLTFTFESNIAHELKIDQSVSHNGVCLTVVDVQLSISNYQLAIGRRSVSNQAILVEQSGGVSLSNDDELSDEREQYSESHGEPFKTQHSARYKVTAIDETLQKTNLGKLSIGDKLNLERCMPANGRFDGHIVQGHVDQTGICTAIEDHNGSWLISFEYDESNNNITVEKGSICVNGVSLTVVNSKENGFSVAIIPYTWEHTNFHQLSVGSIVNLEFDILGKYMQRILARK